MHSAILLRFAFLCAGLATGAVAHATIWTVGPGEAINDVAEVARRAHDGDVVEIRSGDYRGQVAVWTQKSLTIRGLGERPVFHADGKDAEGKAIWVIRNGDFQIDNVEFRGARVADGNGAGIRFEKGRLAISRCAFIDNQNGVLTANFEDAELTISDSLFAQAPLQTEPLPHLLYVGRIAKLEVLGSRFHNGHIGHLIKSRARQTVLKYNLIHDGPGGKASYEVDLPNGGDALLVGNIIGQSRDTDNPVVIAYGAEGGAWPENRLTLAHNTLYSDDLPGGWFLRVWQDRIPGGAIVTGRNNVSVGLGLFTWGASGEFSGNLALPPGALEPDMLDFRLGNWAWLDLFSEPLAGHDPARPTAEFALPIGTRPLPALQTWRPGALQTEE